MIISIEISLKSSIATNALVIIFALIYLLYRRIKFKNLMVTLLTPLIAAFTIFATLYWFTPQPSLTNALSLSSRIYVYILTIYCVMVGTSPEELARSFEQNFHLPSKFAYGVLAALNIVPRMKEAVKQIRIAGMMRGVYLSFWSPILYFKAILIALNSAENLAQGMESHGYRENAKRSVITAVPITKSDYLWLIGILILVNIALFTLE